MGLQMLRDCVLRWFNAEGPVGLDRPRPLDSSQSWTTSIVLR